MSSLAELISNPSNLPMFEWDGAVFYGVLIVTVYSWSRFDEPTYNKIQYFSIYKPQFATSNSSYLFMKITYILLSCAIFVGASLVSKVVGANGPLTSPIAIAMYVVTLQNVPGLLAVERAVRAVLHATAKIPQRVRQTAEQMCTADFKFENFDLLKLSTSLIRRVWGPDAADSDRRTIIHYIREIANSDKILHDWLLIACLLSALSDRNGSKSKIEIKPSFIDEYKYEIDSITANHAAAFNDVAHHLENICNRKETDDPPTLAANLEEIRRRLFAFIACGVRSSVATDIQSAEILQGLGFSGSFSSEHDSSISDLLLLLSICLLFAALGFVLSTEVMYAFVKDAANALHLPQDAANGFYFFLSTAFFYTVTITSGLRLRERRMGRADWFNLNEFERRIPLKKYLSPTVAGALCGLAGLFFIALFCGPGFRCAPIDTPIFRLNEPGSALDQSWRWFPVAIFLAAAFLWVSDRAQMTDKTRAPLMEFILRSLVLALLMAITVVVCEFTLLPPLDTGALDVFDKVVVLIFYPMQSAILSGIMLLIVQLYFYDRASTLRRIVERRIITPQDRSFYIVFEDSGRALWYCDRHHACNGVNPLRRGLWLRFPEGLIVAWDRDNIANFPGDVGLISELEKEIFYRAYEHEISSQHLWLMQLDTRLLFGEAAVGFIGSWGYQG